MSKVQMVGELSAWGDKVGNFAEESQSVCLTLLRHPTFLKSRSRYCLELQMDSYVSKQVEMWYRISFFVGLISEGDGKKGVHQYICLSAIGPPS